MSAEATAARLLDEITAWVEGLAPSSAMDELLRREILQPDHPRAPDGSSGDRGRLGFDDDAEALMAASREDLLVWLRSCRVSEPLPCGPVALLLPELCVSAARSDDPQLVAAFLRVAQLAAPDSPAVAVAWRYLADNMQEGGAGFGLISSELLLSGSTPDSLTPRLAMAREVVWAARALLGRTPVGA